MLDGFRDYLNANGYSINTVKGYVLDVKEYLQFVIYNDENPYSSEIIHKFFDKMIKQKLKPASIERILSSLRTYFQFQRNIYGKIEAVFPEHLKAPEKPITFPNYLDKASIKKLIKLLAKWKKEAFAHRDYFIVLFLASTGARASELVELKPIQVQENGFLTLHGKGSKDRVVYLPNFTQNEYKEYLERFKEIIIKNDRVFFNGKRNPLGRDGLRFILRQLEKNLVHNYPEFLGKLKPHVFRHSYASMLLNEGADVRKICELMGHSSLNTTQRYTHFSSFRYAGTINKFHPHGNAKKD